MKRKELFFFFCIIYISFGVAFITHTYYAINNMVFFEEIPDNYYDACDKYFGKEQWTTIGMDWISHDPEFVLKHGDLFYYLINENGIGHEYGCVHK